MDSGVVDNLYNLVFERSQKPKVSQDSVELPLRCGHFSAKN